MLALEVSPLYRRTGSGERRVPEIGTGSLQNAGKGNALLAALTVIAALIVTLTHHHVVVGVIHLVEVVVLSEHRLPNLLPILVFLTVCMCIIRPPFRH
jgi:hypothetical protein